MYIEYGSAFKISDEGGAYTMDMDLFHSLFEEIGAVELGDIRRTIYYFRDIESLLRVMCITTSHNFIYAYYASKEYFKDVLDSIEKVTFHKDRERTEKPIIHLVVKLFNKF